jgi:hypothetical protein
LATYVTIYPSRAPRNCHSGDRAPAERQGTVAPRRSTVHRGTAKQRTGLTQRCTADGKTPRKLLWGYSARRACAVPRMFFAPFRLLCSFSSTCSKSCDSAQRKRGVQARACTPRSYHLKPYLPPMRIVSTRLVFCCAS